MSKVQKTHTRKRKIKPLPQTLIDQIAAGEVVERPASVVKELIENALDAGASKIEIHLEDGGTRKIQIIDDGFGMPEAELAVALQRHTTSKISNLNDLEKIASYGFRGEALSSISSVSKVTIKSRTPDQEKAFEIQCNRGKIGKTKAKAGAVGTSIAVEGLFDKIPARQKFLRSASTEFSHCARTVKEVALGSTEVRFSIFHQGRAVHHYRNTERKTRVSECQKMKWTPMLVQDSTRDFEFEAYLSPPEAITDKGELLWVINGRCVKHRSFQSAIRNAYRDTLGPHHVPSGVVYLDLRTDWVDVNVHPQKTEVRILKQERIYPWIVSLIRKTIANARSVREYTTPERSEDSRVPPTLSESLSYVEPTPAPNSTRTPFRPEPPRRPVPQALFEDDDQVTRPSRDLSELTDSSTAENTDVVQGLKYLGQAKASYLVCEDRDGLLLVDQHALHEKLFFEQLCQTLEQDALKTQKLLVPKVITIEAEWIALIEEHSETLQRFGFEISVVGESEIALKTRPTLIEEDQADQVVKELIKELSENPSVSKSTSSGFHQAIRPLLATIACHSVIRANHALSRMEAESLLSQMDELELGQTCPHGRPVLFRLGYKTIEKHFER